MKTHDTMEEWKLNWRRNWLESISEFADIEQQRTKWLDMNETNPHWSFVEFMSCYFDDLALNDGYDRCVHDGFVTSEEFEIVSDLHSALVAYAPPVDACHCAEVLEDPVWLRLVETARATRQRLLNTLNDPDERQHLLPGG